MRIRIIIALCAIAVLSASGAANGTLTLENGEEHKGVISWSSRAKSYVMKVGKIEQQFKKPDVAEINIEKPDTFDAAVAQVANGQGAAAIPVLEQIVKEYAHLQWDKAAGRYLAEVYLDAGKPTDALKVCEEIIKGEPSAAYQGDLAPAYWSALLSLNRRSPLENCLKKAVRCNDRFARGAALIMRGDITIKDGNESIDACRTALADHYLRVVFLYKGDDVAAKLRPEALYKAARCFDKLGQGGRADFMRRELRSAYASSPWARR